MADYAQDNYCCCYLILLCKAEFVIATVDFVILPLGLFEESRCSKTSICGSWQVENWSVLVLCSIKLPDCEPGSALLAGIPGKLLFQFCQPAVMQPHRGVICFT